jgi:hypothetical protein
MRIDWLALYQKSLLGGLGGLFGWALLAWFAPASQGVYATALVNGALVGLALGGCCGAWDGLFRNRGPRRAVTGAAIGAGVGLAGGVVGLTVGQITYDVAGGGLPPRAVGWALFGAAVGANEGLARRMPSKVLYGSYGGFLGGLVGGSTYEWVSGRALALFARENALAVGQAVGLVLLGLFVGAFMGLVEDLLRAAWLVFTAGRLEGQTRTLDPKKAATRIGRSETADICILGDRQLAPQHARILCAGGAFVVEAVDGPVLHGQAGRLTPVARQALAGGDVIQVGASRAQFHVGGGRS